MKRPILVLSAALLVALTGCSSQKSAYVVAQPSVVPLSSVPGKVVPLPKSLGGTSSVHSSTPGAKPSKSMTSSSPQFSAAHSQDPSATHSQAPSTAHPPTSHSPAPTHATASSHPTSPPAPPSRPTTPPRPSQPTSVPTHLSSTQPDMPYTTAGATHAASPASAPNPAQGSPNYVAPQVGAPVVGKCVRLSSGNYSFPLSYTFTGGVYEVATPQGASEHLHGEPYTLSVTQTVVGRAVQYVTLSGSYIDVYFPQEHSLVGSVQGPDVVVNMSYCP